MTKHWKVCLDEDKVGVWAISQMEVRATTLDKAIKKARRKSSTFKTQIDSGDFSIFQTANRDNRFFKSKVNHYIKNKNKPRLAYK